MALNHKVVPLWSSGRFLERGGQAQIVRRRYHLGDVRSGPCVLVASSSDVLEARKYAVYAWIGCRTEMPPLLTDSR